MSIKSILFFFITVYCYTGFSQSKECQQLIDLMIGKTEREYQTQAQCRIITEIKNRNDIKEAKIIKLIKKDNEIALSLPNGTKISMDKLKELPPSDIEEIQKSTQGENLFIISDILEDSANFRALSNFCYNKGKARNVLFAKSENRIQNFYSAPRLEEQPLDILILKEKITNCDRILQSIEDIFEERTKVKFDSLSSKNTVILITENWEGLNIVLEENRRFLADKYLILFTCGKRNSAHNFQNILQDTKGFCAFTNQIDLRVVRRILSELKEIETKFTVFDALPKAIENAIKFLKNSKASQEGDTSEIDDIIRKLEIMQKTLYKSVHNTKSNFLPPVTKVA